MVYYNTYCIYYHDSLRSIVTSILTLLPPLSLKPEPIPLNRYNIYEPIRICVSPFQRECYPHADHRPHDGGSSPRAVLR